MPGCVSCKANEIGVQCQGDVTAVRVPLMCRLHSVGSRCFSPATPRPSSARCTRAPSECHRVQTGRKQLCVEVLPSCGLPCKRVPNHED